MNSKPKVGIISSVPANPFAALDFDALGFSGDEKKAALTEEIALFLNTTDPKYLSYLQQS